MPWFFLLGPLVFFLFFSRRWDRRPGWDRLPRRRGKRAERDAETATELETQRGYIEALEMRVAELENRLDFTERLLAGRSAPSAS